MFSKALEAKSNPSLSGQLKINRDPIRIEHTYSKDSVTHQIDDGNFPRKHTKA